MAHRTLSQAQARALAIGAQGLGATPVSGGVPGVLACVGAIQLDTISVLARSHELVPYARLASTSRSDVESALWGTPPATFEYWSHAACVLPLADYHWFAFRRRAFRRRGIRWHEVPPARVQRAVLARLADGPATATDLGGAKRGGPWWDWSQAKIAVEWLLDTGEVICSRRTGWRRDYQLAEHVVPPVTAPGWETRDGVYGPTDDECLDTLLERSVVTLGVGTLDDVVDVHRLTSHGFSRASLRKRLEGLVEQGAIKSVSVRGWDQASYADPSATAARSTTAMLSPFDSLVWHRARVARLFDLDFRLEAYTPAAKRVHGYFAMPVLHRNALVALVDPGRERDRGSTTLVAKTVTFAGGASTEAVRGTASALARAARWVGADQIRVDRVVPASAARALRQAVAGAPNATKPKS